MQRDGSFDLIKLQASTDEVIGMARTQSSIANPVTTFRAGMPYIRVDVDRTKARQLNVPVTSIFETMQIYLGSLYVNDFNLFGRTFRVTLQADT